MVKGIYCYIDTKNEKIVYIGKDSHIDKEKRKKAHNSQNRYEEQVINRIIQNNPTRYKYKILKKFNNISEEELNNAERDYISKYNPKFNFTDGGDGRSGRSMRENNPMKSPEVRKKVSQALTGIKRSEETKQKLSQLNTGSNHPQWKDYATAYNCGKDGNDKQVYAIRYNGEILKKTVNKKMAEELCIKLNNNEITANEIKNTHNPNWKKDNYRIVKAGNTNGKPMYALMGKDHKRIKRSHDKKKLEKLIEELINN